MQLYQVDSWGTGYFGINQHGNAQAFPRCDGENGIDLKAVVDGAIAQGYTLPLLIRFPDMLSHRVTTLHHCFQEAIAKCHYQGVHLSAYPLKVNQQQPVVREILRFGAFHGMGLEVGSKSELHAAVAAVERSDSMIICNGHKDSAYIRLALLAQQLGKQVYLVLEKPTELELVQAVARELGITPQLGVRVRLHSEGAGKWAISGGDRSKFGLSPNDLLQMIEKLRAQQALQQLTMMHTHLGSQITELKSIETGMAEVARYYMELRQLGCPLQVVNVGGGLGVNYGGEQQFSGFTMDYSETNYASSVVAALKKVCETHHLPHPNIITESGRALTAHHTLLALEVLQTSSQITEKKGCESQHQSDNALPPQHDVDQMNSNVPVEWIEQYSNRFKQLQQMLTVDNAKGCWDRALKVRTEMYQAFVKGSLSLTHYVMIESQFWSLCTAIQHCAPEEFSDGTQPLQALLAEKYYGNFSVFRSLPDAWAIGQEFPLMPLHRLEQKPTINGVLQDITCDSDGQLLKYVHSQPFKNTIPLHPLLPTEPYYLGIFLNGAYQEILGDLHNLFGDTNAVHVSLDAKHGWRYTRFIKGESVARVLQYVQFQEKTLRRRLQKQIKRAELEGRLDASRGDMLLKLYDRGLEDTSYLQSRQTKVSLKSD